LFQNVSTCLPDLTMLYPWRP